MFPGHPGAHEPSAKTFLGQPKSVVLGLLGPHSTAKVYGPLSCLQACDYYNPCPNGHAVMSETWNNPLTSKNILTIIHRGVDGTQYTELC